MNCIIIVAGGSGKRMGTQIPKQFLKLNNKPILLHTIEVFHNYDNTIDIYVVLPEKHISIWNKLYQESQTNIKHHIIKGGKERFFSVKNALDSLKNNYKLIGIHDGVRPLVSKKTIQKCFSHAVVHGNAIPYITAIESVRIIEKQSNKYIDRNKIALIQTPQVFQSEVLLQAYKNPFSEKYTDDASVVESNNHKIHLVEGNRENIKITNKEDLKLAEYHINKNNNYVS